jgi:hypothetical protein
MKERKDREKRGRVSASASARRVKSEERARDETEWS